MTGWRGVWHRLRHPVSGLSHLAGAALSVAGLVALLVVAGGRPWHTVAFAVYGVTLIFLYTASGLYHLLKLPRVHEERLFALDRAAIYLLIAGTYTPVCLLILPPAWGWSLLGVVWSLALIGIVGDTLSRRRAPDWLQAVFYLATGWPVLIALKPLSDALPVAALVWLGAGSLVYSIGAIICVVNRPHIHPRFFNAHDLWHVLVMAGSACHFIVMFHFVAAA